MKKAIPILAVLVFLSLPLTVRAEQGVFDNANLIDSYDESMISSYINHLFSEKNVIIRLETHQAISDTPKYVKDTWDRLGMDTKGKPEYNILAVYVNSTNELILGRSNECALPADVLTRIAENVSTVINRGDFNWAFRLLVVSFNLEIYSRVNKPIECPPEGLARIKELITQLENPGLDVKETASAELTRIGEPAVPELIKSLEEDYREMDPDSIVMGGGGKKTWVIAILGNIGSEEAIPVLVKVLGDEIKYVREEASGALAKIGEPAIPALVEALDQNWAIDEAATEALAKIGEPAIPALIKRLNFSSAAAEALSKIGEPAMPALLEAIKDPNDNVRMRAAKALGGMGPKAKQAIPALIKALDDSFGRVRDAAADALGDIGSEEAVPVLIEALKERDMFEVNRAAIALAKIGKPAIPALLDALDSYDANVRKTAVEILSGSLVSPSEMGEPIIPILIQKLNTYSPYSQSSGRNATMSVLSKIGIRAVYPLLEMPDTSEIGAYGVENAAEALFRLYTETWSGGKDAVISILIEVLEKNESITMRWTAAVALGKIGSDKAEDALKKAALNDPSGLVRNSAAEALGKLRKRVPIAPAMPQAVWIVVLVGVVAAAGIVMGKGFLQA
jgi:HEAT repeat protein